MATSFLRFCRADNVDGMTFASAVGVLGWDYDAGEGSM